MAKPCGGKIGSGALVFAASKGWWAMDARYFDLRRIIYVR